MIYNVHYPAPKTPAQIMTSDEIIIQTTPALRWAIGKHLGWFRHNCREYGLELEVCLDQTKCSASLGTEPTTERPPTH